MSAKEYHTRMEIKQHYTKEFLDNILEKGHDFKSSLGSVIDAGYCYGYNIVLEAAEKVFGGFTENYWKIVKKLEEWDIEREKELDNENNN